ncbi:MAG: hypothetical protein M0R75_01580 [Dehalococcoidia bacterium]|nr:hypothetical protein [Dehalococcoidia bacterium]
MRTTYPHTGFRETPPDLLDRFGARIGLFHALAWSAIEVRDLAERAGADADLEMPIEMARAIVELHDDYQDLRAALMTWEWTD